MRILIADDSALIRERLIHLLADVQGAEVVGQAGDAAEARGLAAKLKPDVAILDLRMPRGSGADVLQDIKRLDPAPMVIVLTNYPHPENRQKCIDRGADYFFDKATEFKNVVSVLSKMVRGPAGSTPG
jgi:DNA-binding NarL/FixJ family response regulator